MHDDHGTVTPRQLLMSPESSTTAARKVWWSSWRRTSWISPTGHTFWSRRSLRVFTPELACTFTAWELACLLVTLLIIAAVFLAINVLLRNYAYHPSTPPHVHVFLNGSAMVKGVIVLADGIRVRRFLGIRYAKPPLSKRRFRNPEPIAITEVSVINAVHSSPPCPQREANGSEDCLRLSIWTPHPESSRTAERSSDWTVLFVLHGGFFQAGGVGYYDGRFFAALGNLVVVAPDYRLGVLGFLRCDSHEAPGNAGLMDQLEAIRWTRDNIAAFGGNPFNIVLMGHEAGAASVGHHLQNLRQSLGVKKAIFLSGSAYTRYPEQAQNFSAQLGALHSCPRNQKALIACLRVLPVEKLVSVEGLPLFFPTIDRPQGQLTTGWIHTQANDVDVILGYEEDEGDIMMSLLVNDHLRRKTLNCGTGLVCIAEEMLRMVGITGNDSKEIVRQYSEDSKLSTDRWLKDLVADVFVVCPVQYYAKYLAAEGSSVLTYFVERQESFDGPEMKKISLTDLLFVTPMLRYHESVEQHLSRRVIHHFADFANGVRNAIYPTTISGARLSIIFRPWKSAFADATSGFALRQRQCSYLKPNYL